MELNWSTFILELINFLVLVWILKRFLYRPVLDTIAKRRAAVQKTLADAQATHQEAEAMQAQYQNRLADWSKEQEEAHAQLRTELAAERKRLTEALEQELDTQREKARVQAEQEQRAQVRRCEEAALAQAAHFASRLLAGLTGPELEDRLTGLALEQLGELSGERREAVAAALTQLVQAKEGSLSLHVQQNPDLIAGLRISVGPWVLRANLRDELAFFTEAGHEH